MMSEQPVTTSDQTSGSFQQLLSQFTRLLNGRSEGDRQQINCLFDELNALDFKTAFVTNSAAAVLLINHCCSVVTPNDTFLVAKGCQLISNLVLKQEVKVEGKTLLLTVNWILESLKHCADIALLDILLALEAIFRGNGKYIVNSKDLLLPNSILMSFLDPVKMKNLKIASPWEVHLATIRCLESVTQSSSEDKLTAAELKDSYLPLCKQIFFDQFEYNRAANQDELNYCKILTTSIKGLQNVIQSLPQLDHLGDLLGVVKAFMVYGLPGHTGLKPEKVHATHAGAGDSESLSTVQSNTRRGNKNIQARKQRKKISESSRKIFQDNGANDPPLQGPTNNFRMYTVDNKLPTDVMSFPSWSKTSESEFSDAEGGQAAKVHTSQSKVRLTALTLLFSIIKLSERKEIFGYWSNLLPTGPSTPQTRTLITCLLKDPSPRCRMATLNAITTLFLGSRLYLQQAECNKKSSTSFTTFSVSLGNMLSELHRSLCLALIAEHSTVVLAHLLKCFAALVQNTPYHRLETGLATKVLRNIRVFLKHKDLRVHVAALTVIGSFAAIEPNVPEISEQLSKPLPSRPRLLLAEAEAVPTEDKTSEEKVDANLVDDLNSIYLEEDVEESSSLADASNKMSWLVEHCLENLSDKLRIGNISPIPIRIESLQVLSVISRNLFLTTIAPHLSSVVKALQMCFKDVDLTIHRHAGHVVESIGLAIQSNLPITSLGTIGLDTSVEFWQLMLSGPITSLIQNTEDTTLRTAGCDCLASIGSDVFQELKRDKQILIVTILFGCCKDVDHNVRSSAVRALAIYVLFAVLREDIHFVMDTAESVMAALKDASLSVRVKSSWSLGNLSDALVQNNKDGMEEIPDSLLLQLLDASIEASRDHEKLRSNAVRSLGNLMLLYTDDLIGKPKFKETADKAINALVQNATNGNNMKVRWNACYAMGNMLKNSTIYKENHSALATVFSSLTSLVLNFRNFKVRINAATALATPPERIMYGSHFTQVWDGLMSGLDNSQVMDDFKEYKHQDNLINQICATLIHLMTLITPQDLSPLHDLLLLHLETTQKQILRYHLNVVPEKEGDLMSASHHALSLLHLAGLTSEQRSAANLLVNIFSQDTERDQM